jgi:hypothetical protein
MGQQSKHRQGTQLSKLGLLQQLINFNINIAYQVVYSYFKILKHHHDQ